MQTYQISVEDKDSTLLLQILHNIKIIQNIQNIQNERDSWVSASTQLLNDAYSEHEPDYAEVPLKNINKSFQA